ncbi:hypothetical protein K466DRAFT_397529 [Polyporus arcularius HHB13444]|uniref:Chromatin modification-related protein n=1 Tax=Polyporus arcularius HHB13444 TaxID=1314778 RepID=A0A5C3PWM4_9APHY|nr:hypothetical protein K466DRAFT_397529 [Polyporus arcularius HHB13444]
MNANLEEAANIATEYLSSLENLPNEAQHILTEIRHREAKTQELAEEIRRETQKYFRHSQKNAGQPSLPAKDAAIPATVNGLYAEVDLLAAEKIALSARLVKLLERAMARLQHDLQKILKLQGEEPGLPPTQHFLSNVDTTVQQLQTSLRNAVAAAVSPPPPAPPAAPPPQKKRRVAAAASAGSIKLPSPVPVSNSGYNSSSGTQKSSLSRVNTRHSPVRQRRGPTHAPTGLDDEDAEGEEDEEGGDAEDQGIYCYCQKLSYGEMIGCDNDSCRLQWFHLSCVNLTAENLPQTWYCDECSAQLGLSSTQSGSASTGGGRKGRKK